MSSKRLNLYYRLPVVGLCGLIFWQSSFPSVISEPLFPHDDKIMHILVYGCLAFLAARDLAMEKPGWPLRTIRMAAFFFAVAYGATDEIHQGFTAGRHASFLDLLADGIGGFFGVLLYSKTRSVTKPYN